MKFSTHKFDDVVRMQRAYGADAALTGTDISLPGAIVADPATTSPVVTNEPTPAPAPAPKVITEATPTTPVLPGPLVAEAAPSTVSKPSTINFIIPPTYSTNVPTTPYGFGDMGSRTSGGGGGGGVEAPAEQAVKVAKSSGKGLLWFLLLTAAGTGLYMYNK